jgi:hypothetical protein
MMICFTIFINYEYLSSIKDTTPNNMFPDTIKLKLRIECILINGKALLGC